MFREFYAIGNENFSKTPQNFYNQKSKFQHFFTPTLQEWVCIINICKLLRLTRISTTNFSFFFFSSFLSNYELFDKKGIHHDSERAIGSRVTFSQIRRPNPKMILSHQEKAKRRRRRIWCTDMNSQLELLSFTVLLSQSFFHKIISSFSSSLLRGNVDIREMHTYCKKSSTRGAECQSHRQFLGCWGEAHHHFLSYLHAQGGRFDQW